MSFYNNLSFTIFNFDLGPLIAISLFQSLGNHEFDNGISGLVPFIENVNYPIIASNLILTKVPELAKQANLKKSVIITVSGIKIGVIGYLTPDTKLVSIKNDVEFEEEVSAIQEEVQSLQYEGVNIIIALGHSGYIKDKQIAKEIEGVDVVIGGHSHTLLWNGATFETEDPEGPYPTYVTQSSGKVVPVVQAYAYTKYMGSLRLIFNSKGDLIASTGTPILLDNTVPEDPEVARLVQNYEKQIKQVTNKIVGSTSVALDARYCDKKECNMGNFITDAMVYHYAAQYDGEHWTDAPIGLLQAGGIRASIMPADLPADLSMGDLITVMPFKNPLATVTMNGSTLIQVLEHSVANNNETRIREFLQMSGLKVVYDYNNLAQSRVVKAYARCWACSVPEYYSVENKEVYKVIMPKILAQGGDGYAMLKDLPAYPLPYNELNSTLYYVQKNSPVRPEIEGRITILQKELRNGAIELSQSVMVVYLTLIGLILSKIPV